MASAAQTWHEVADEDDSHPYRMTIDQFEALFEAGLLGDERIELRDGVMVRMSPQYLPHARAKMRIYDSLRNALIAAGSGLEVTVELSVRIAPFNLPAPDLIVFEPVEKLGPLAIERAALVVEVSDTTRREDLVRKPVLYGAAGAPEYWVVDLKSRVIHRMSDPDESGYRVRDSVAFGETIAMVTRPNIVVDTTSLLDI